VKDPVREATERLRAAKLLSARADARILWRHAEGRDDVFQQFIARRLSHEPVAYITGHKEFWSLDFDVGPGVLIPRPETETLVEQALRELGDRTRSYRLLDLGTGSGCLLIALLKELSNATGIGVDASADALAVASTNLLRHGLVNRAALVAGGWDAAPGQFDLIVANPPYVRSGDLQALPPDVRDNEPKEALDGGPDGLDAYRSLAFLLPRYLSSTGIALLEIGAGQHQVVGLMEAAGLVLFRIVPDLAGIPRCLVVGLGRGLERLAQKKIGNRGPTR